LAVPDERLVTHSHTRPRGEIVAIEMERNIDVLKGAGCRYGRAGS
jgi:hypothetical protein